MPQRKVTLHCHRYQVWYLVAVVVWTTYQTSNKSALYP